VYRFLIKGSGYIRQVQPVLVTNTRLRFCASWSKSTSSRWSFEVTYYLSKTQTTRALAHDILMNGSTLGCSKKCKKARKAAQAMQHNNDYNRIRWVTVSNTFFQRRLRCGVVSSMGANYIIVSTPITKASTTNLTPHLETYLSKGLEKGRSQAFPTLKLLSTTISYEKWSDWLQLGSIIAFRYTLVQYVSDLI
jgi:hypothetical protein